MNPSVIVNGIEYVTVNEAQRRAGVSRRTLYNWVTSGRLTAFRLGGRPNGPLRFKADDLRWLAVKETE